MTVDEMVAFFKAHGVEPEEYYTLGGLGGGDIDGIESIDGEWYTYHSERGSKNGYKRWESEEAAVASILTGVEFLARRYGVWRELPEDGPEVSEAKALYLKYFGKAQG